MRPSAALLLIAVLGMGWTYRGPPLRCGQQPRQYPRNFYFAAACTKSRMTQIAASYASSLEQCKQYAARKRGLAINYVNRGLLYDDVKNYSGPTCLVFDCPEFEVQLSFDMDAVFDYYTMYARPMPSINGTCLPRLGVYLIHRERLNFTEAQSVCESENGYLADVSNAPKSVQLGAALLKEHLRKAFVGLSQVEGTLLTSTGMPLECLPYRAWAPGEPKQGRQCTFLTHDGSWSSANCSVRSPFVCELKPTGPLRPCADVAWRWKKTCRENFARFFPNHKRWPKCGDPVTDEKTFKLPTYKKRKYNYNGTEIPHRPGIE